MSSPTTKKLALLLRAWYRKGPDPPTSRIFLRDLRDRYRLDAATFIKLRKSVRTKVIYSRSPDVTLDKQRTYARANDFRPDGGRRKRTWTFAEVQKVLRLRDRGLSHREIAMKMQCSLYGVRHILQRDTLVRRLLGRKWNQEDASRLLRKSGTELRKLLASRSKRSSKTPPAG